MREKEKMTNELSELLQAKHRLEEAEMRDRRTERNRRTNRLIRHGATFEHHFPESAEMNDDEFDALVRELRNKY